MSLTLDHIAIAATSLDEGSALVEATLEVPLAPGGEHPLMGTHNRLLSLGSDAYLEVIAINPAAPAPPHTRWFDLDRFAGAPRVRNWIARSDNLATALAAAPAGSGEPLALSRGDLAWTMAVPPDGRLPFDGCFPALIQWQGSAHPAPRLPDRGVRLTGLHLLHPQAGALRAALATLIDDSRLHVETADHPAIRAVFSTPLGQRSL